MRTATLVCLANSKKHSGRCLAGKAFHDGTYSEWVRPVTEHPHQELQHPEHCLQSGEDSLILDLLEISFLGPRGDRHQQENWLMDPLVPLKKLGRLSIEHARRIVDTPASLWGIGSSSANGLNDRIPLNEILKVSTSLYLVEVESFYLKIVEETYLVTRKKMAGYFSYQGSDYKLKITDPEFKRKFVDSPVGDYDIGRTLLTISLGENFNGNHYKIIAGIIPIEYSEKRSSP